MGGNSHVKYSPENERAAIRDAFPPVDTSGSEIHEERTRGENSYSQGNAALDPAPGYGDREEKRGSLSKRGEAEELYLLRPQT